MKTNDSIIARQCLNFKGYYCYNNDCTNKSCPLNKEWDEEV